ncbi:hypothetical protein [Oryza sativa Japonica Group]|uniref:Uncharacterized protein n=1 Tax=Oryza sativa subsp. japonica TaxID=39947 RepID=Q5JMH6_ORYSJ|nr:hypothetical protein [Oryza sativa Japonica Group]BAD87335.1 hypothetical protein [Oryza sativa Japonica Group]
MSSGLVKKKTYLSNTRRSAWFRVHKEYKILKKEGRYNVKAVVEIVLSGEVYRIIDGGASHKSEYRIVGAGGELHKSAHLLSSLHLTILSPRAADGAEDGPRWSPPSPMMRRADEELRAHQSQRRRLAGHSPMPSMSNHSLCYFRLTHRAEQELAEPASNPAPPQELATRADADLQGRGELESLAYVFLNGLLQLFLLDVELRA